jgi:hypothetical protein
MKKINKTKIGGIVLSALLLLFSTPLYAYAGKVFIPHTAVSSANLGAVNQLEIVVSSTAVNQTGGGTPPENYTVTSNGSYQGASNYIALDVLSSTGSTVYCLLKGNGRYAVASAALGDPVAPDRLINALSAYNQGAPTPPAIGSILAGFETAKVESFTYSSDYNYAGISIEVLGSNLGVTSHKKISEYAVGEYVDGRLLESGKKYTFKVKGVVEGVAPELSLWGEKVFTMEVGGGAQSYVLTFEAGADGKPGINFFSMPVPPDKDGKWYAETLAGAYLGEVANAYQLVNAINSAAGTDQKIVSTFGRWDNSPAEQKDAGVLIQNNDPAQVTAVLGNIPLKQGEGYQVYVNQKVSLRIKNTQ